MYANSINSKSLTVSEDSNLNGISFSSKTGGISWDLPYTLLNVELNLSLNSVFASFQLSTYPITPETYTVEGGRVTFTIGPLTTKELEPYAGNNSSLLVNISVVESDGTLSRIPLSGSGVVNVVGEYLQINNIINSWTGDITLTNQKIVIQCIIVNSPYIL